MMKHILVIYNSNLTDLFKFLPMEKCVFWKHQDTFEEMEQFSNIKLIITFNGSSSFSDAVQLFIEQQYTMHHVPLIICPYALDVYMLKLPILFKIHALEHAEEPHDNHSNLYQQFITQQDKLNIDNGLFVCDPMHPIMRHVQTFKCPTSYRDPRVRAKSDARLLAMWNDGVPMVAERNNCIAINFCLTNADPETDAKRIMHQAIDYLLQKNESRLQKNLYHIVAFRNVHFLFGE